MQEIFPPGYTPSEDTASHLEHAFRSLADRFAAMHGVQLAALTAGNLTLISDSVNAAIDSGHLHLLICKGGCPKGLDLFTAPLCCDASPLLEDYCRSIRNFNVAMASCFIEDDEVWNHFLETEDASYLREARPPIVCLDRLQQCPACSARGLQCPPIIENKNVADITDTINASIILALKKAGFSMTLLAMGTNAMHGTLLGFDRNTMRHGVYPVASRFEHCISSILNRSTHLIEPSSSSSSSSSSSLVSEVLFSCHPLWFRNCLEDGRKAITVDMLTRGVKAVSLPSSSFLPERLAEALSKMEYSGYDYPSHLTPEERSAAAAAAARASWARLSPADRSTRSEKRVATARSNWARLSPAERSAISEKWAAAARESWARLSPAKRAAKNEKRNETMGSEGRAAASVKGHETRRRNKWKKAAANTSKLTNLYKK